MDDLISRQAAIDAANKLVDRFEQILRDIRETNEDESVCGLCEYDGAFIGQSGDWCNECEIKITSRGKRMTAYVLCRLPKMDKSIMLTATEMGQYPLVRSGRKYHYKTEDKKNGNESD